MYLAVDRDDPGVYTATRGARASLDSSDRFLRVRFTGCAAEGWLGVLKVTTRGGTLRYDGFSVPTVILISPDRAISETLTTEREWVDQIRFEASEWKGFYKNVSKPTSSAHAHVKRYFVEGLPAAKNDQKRMRSDGYVVGKSRCAGFTEAKPLTVTKEEEAAIEAELKAMWDGITLK